MEDAEVEIPIMCEECGANKKDVIIKPCNHFEYCFKCLIKEINFNQDQLCPTCNCVNDILSKAVTGVLVIEQIIGSVNLKVLQEFLMKQDEVAAAPESIDKPLEIPVEENFTIKMQKGLTNSEAQLPK